MNSIAPGYIAAHFPLFSHHMSGSKAIDCIHYLADDVCTTSLPRRLTLYNLLMHKSFCL